MTLPVFPNLVYPAFAAPYMSALLFPLAGAAAMLSEVIVYCRLNKETRRPWIVVSVVFVNVVSSLIGIAIANLLPSGLTQKLIEAGDRHTSVLAVGPNYTLLALAGFVVALLLSIVIEYFLLKPFAGRIKIHDPFRTVKWANITSYSVLFILVLLNMFIGM